MQHVKRWMLTAGRMFSRLEDSLLVVVLGVMIFLAVMQIVQRNILGNGFVWTDELLRILVLWLTMLGSIIASRSNNHIKMDLLLKLLSVVWQQRVQRVVHLCTAIACGVLAWVSAQFVLMEYQFGSLLLGDYPSWWFQLILPVGFFLIAWRYLLLMLWPRNAEDQVPCC